MKRYIRHFTAYTLAGLIGISTCLTPTTALAAGWEKSGPTSVYQMPDGTPIPRALGRGIDVSYWKQNIDWNQVAADDVRFAMIATRFKGEEDPFFSVNARGAVQAGIGIGAYIYSYATSVEMAEQEADFVLNIIKDYPISYPVAFDAEDAGTLGTLPPDQVSAIINAFCRKIEAAGYHPMVYANEYWIKNKIDMSALDYDIWVAKYNQMHTYENPAMWQATNTGAISGVNGNVDINFLYKDFSTVIPANTWRTIAGNTYYYQNYMMQKSAWIDDGQGRYYMNEAGNPSKGWLTFPEGRYYLDETTGKAAVDWKELGGSWYYFDPNGLMATGWREIGTDRFYLDSEGRMQTGFLDIDGGRYYLTGSGAMARGFQDVDGARYYFGPAGTMQTGWQTVEGSIYYLDPTGVMQRGWQTIDGAIYYLDGEGRMQTGWQELDRARYYLGADGKMQTGFVAVDGVMYYFDQSGVMQTGIKDVDGARYYLSETGAVQTGWHNIGGVWFYFAADGKMATGWQSIDGALYHLDPATGAMSANVFLEQDGQFYLAGADGACTPVDPAALQGLPQQ